MTDALTHAGELAALEAERMWKLDIIDPPHGSKDPRAPASLAAINAIINVNGWGGNVKYTGNGPPQWCGMFAGWCWSRAGLDPSWLPSYFASTYRLLSWARYERWSATSKAQTSKPDRWDDQRRCEGQGRLLADARRGDILIVGDGTPSAGDHVTIIVGVDRDARTFDTISGNGGGNGPDGKSREGVSRRYYRTDATHGYRPLWRVRPGFDDLIAERP